MRLVAIFFAFAVTFASDALAEPSDKETVAWLTSHLRGAVCVFKISGDTYRNDVTVTSFQIENGIMTWVRSWNNPGSGQPAEIKNYSIRLKDLTSQVDLFLTPEVIGGGVSTVSLTGRDGKPAGQFHLYSDSATHVQKAFQHLLRNNAKPARELF